MYSRNPVLNRTDSFQPNAGQSGYSAYQPYQGFDPNVGYQPGQAQPGQFGQAQFGQPGAVPTPAQQGVMTFDDVVTKSAITMGLLIATASVTMIWLMRTILSTRSIGMTSGVLIGSALVGFVLAMVVSFRRQISPALVLIYAAVEGVFIGGLSAFFEVMYPGIVMQAVFGTFVAAGATLAIYKFTNIRVSPKFRQMVVIGTWAVAGALLLNFLLALVAPQFAMGRMGPQMGLLGLGVTVLCVALAVFNLVLDFDMIENGIRNRAPASESWRGAFALTVTMVWLYTEILRLLSFFRSE